MEKLNDLIIDFEETETELELLTETFLLLDEGMENGDNHHPQALALPTIMLKKLSDHLSEIHSNMNEEIKRIAQVKSNA